MFPTANRPDSTLAAVVVADDDGDLTLAGGEQADEMAPGEEPPVGALAAVRWMTVGAGQRLWLTFGDAFPVGPPAAPFALRIARFVDDQWNVGLGDLTPAASLEPGR